MSDIDAALSALSLDTNKPHRMILVNFQTGQPIRDADGKEGWIDIYSSDSEIARKQNRETQRRRYNTRRLLLSPEEQEAAGIDLLVSLTADWYLLSLEGNPIQLNFTAQNARRVYTEVSWVRDQVDTFAADRANFIQPSSPASLNGPSKSSDRAAKP